MKGSVNEPGKKNLAQTGSGLWVTDALCTI